MISSKAGDDAEAKLTRVMREGCRSEKADVLTVFQTVLPPLVGSRLVPWKQPWEKNISDEIRDILRISSSGFSKRQMLGDPIFNLEIRF